MPRSLYRFTGFNETQRLSLEVNVLCALCLLQGRQCAHAPDSRGIRGWPAQLPLESTEQSRDLSRRQVNQMYAWAASALNVRNQVVSTGPDFRLEASGSCRGAWSRLVFVLKWSFPVIRGTGSLKGQGFPDTIGPFSHLGGEYRVRRSWPQTPS